MALDKYNKKRDFEQTPEPQGNDPTTSDELRFVVQKHQASHLHYDLRLELDGVMKSWAVPKGPSLDPSQKRLAHMVEDHPLEYRHFEGTIPKGNYGAGTVMIWDEGTYKIPGGKDRKYNEKTVRSGLERGSLSIIVYGGKLNGEFHLVKMRKGDKSNWLLIKKRDQYATSHDIRENDRSVRTGRSIDAIRSSESQKQSPQPKIDLQNLDFHNAPRRQLKRPVAPMLAQLAEEPFNHEEWVFELKWDGYRAIAELHNGAVQLYSRKANNYAEHYPEIVEELQHFHFNCIMDGEIVVIDENGNAGFNLLQNYRRNGDGFLQYYVFDLLFLEGHDLRDVPLYHRKELLQKILPDVQRVKFSRHVEKEGKALYDTALERGIEGIMAKEKTSPYLTGVRSRHWQKIKTQMRQEVVVGGFTEPQGSRIGIGSLTAGVYDYNGNLLYVGNIGTGFSDNDLVAIRKRLDQYTISKSPFVDLETTRNTTHWIEPKLVCGVKFSEWTNDHNMRQPVFLGFREDADPTSVHRERPVPPSVPKKGKHIPQEPGHAVRIGSTIVPLSNLAKIYWPHDHIRKGDMIDYYRGMATYILPHLYDRPLVLHRFPDGIEGQNFYQKSMDKAPEWIKTVEIETESTSSPITPIVCRDETTLVYMANLGSIEMHPWLSRIGSLEHPDYMVIDLDPVECSFDDVIGTALEVHRVFEEISLPHYVKTSGAKGIHICVPLHAQYTYKQSGQFAQLICTLVHKRLPSITSLERLPQRRRGKVYLDYLQNSKGKTIVSPYSLRPYEGARVSTPLRWDELQRGLIPGHFTMETIKDRVQQYGDLWHSVLGQEIDMARAVNQLRKMYEKE